MYELTIITEADGMEDSFVGFADFESIEDLTEFIAMFGKKMKTMSNEEYVFVTRIRGQTIDDYFIDRTLLVSTNANDSIK